MDVKSVKFRGHHCFKKAWSGFGEFKPINVIIGRNNTGKSRLLDLVEALCVGNAPAREWGLKIAGQFRPTDLRNRFDYSISGGVLGGNHWSDHGRHFVDIDVAVEFNPRGQVLGFDFSHSDGLGIGLSRRDTRVEDARLEELKRVMIDTPLPLRGKSFRRLLAERNMAAEKDATQLALGADGHGATNVIRRYLLSSKNSLPRELIQNDLLSALNEVFGSDGRFTEIEARHHDEPEEGDQSKGHWEIYLGEEKKGLIALSRSGSGLKTVLLVLLNLLVVPHFEGKEKSGYVFAFEELENNLHPALLRRLFGYIERYVFKEKAMVFLTTHSSVALDSFGLSPNAQIIYVTHDGESATAQTVAAHFDRQGIVAELGAKPSDLLQANGIVWVEGPSDRIYLNRWIELLSNSELKEGRDYLCAFYGGALLARTQFTSPEEASAELTNLLRVNANIVVICDSDRTAESGDGSALKERVQRIEAEVQKIPGALIWITAAKEVENYLPGEALAKAFENVALPAPQKFERFFPSEGESFVEQHLKRKSLDKMDLAAMTAPHMTLEQMRTRFDWQEKAGAIVEKIREWNR